MKAEPISLIMQQFLAWVGDRPRTYSDVMEAWRSNCPRLSVWEDALIDGLVQRQGKVVILTAAGRSMLHQNRPEAPAVWREAAE